MQGFHSFEVSMFSGSVTIYGNRYAANFVFRYSCIVENNKLFGYLCKTLVLTMCFWMSCLIAVCLKV